jgi:hypothetical protein
LAALVLGAVLMLAMIFMIAWFESSRISWPNEPFSPKSWRAASQEDRHRQVNDLLSKHELVGLPLAEVEALLGLPDSTSSDGRLVAYVVKSGEADLLSFNFLYLLRLSIDMQGRVSAFEIVAD